MQINKDLRVTDGAYYNLDLDTIAKNGIYSTDEIIVGRWTSGKPIYRRVLTGVKSSEVSQVIATIPNIRPIRYDGIIQSGAVAFQIGAYLDSTNNYSSVYYDLRNGKITLSVPTAYVGADFHVIIEYVKITD